MRAALIYDAIASHGVTHLCGAPIVMATLLNASDAERKPLPHRVEFVTAAAPRVPPALVEQLKPGGKMVIPVGGQWGVQELEVITRRADGGYDRKSVLPVRFVPLVPGK